MAQDFSMVLHWWVTLLIVGVAAFPITSRVFSLWYDKGYFFSKALGLGLITYITYLLSTFHLASFSLTTISIVICLVFILGYYFLPVRNVNYKKIVTEELFFFVCLATWSWVKAHEPSIQGLEKFMDFGFTKTILNTQFFPAADMWFAGKFYINYYYFGHTALALLTKLSSIDLVFTFNLMLASLFAFTATMSFSLVYQLTKKFKIALLSCFLITLGGNLQTIYAFTSGYAGDYPPPFWTIFTGKLNFDYWYANATRFIPFTIHEFPSYSFVVSDIHGHVLSLPFVLLALGVLIEIFWNKRTSMWLAGAYGLIASILLMTNALDGPIYMGLFIVLATFLHPTWINKLKFIFVSILIAIIASLPFLFNFSSFVTGLAVNCPPKFLAETKIGPLLFESIDKCQKSPIWMMLLLWGFFLYCGLWLFSKFSIKQERLMFIFFIFSVGLIIFPEFFYFKDIYPLHFRSNTMFKLGYQAFIIFGVMSGYTMAKIKDKAFWIGLIPLIILVSIFPYFSIRSYFGNLQNYQGLNGSTWLYKQYPDDWAAINWINKNIEPTAVLVEADGDSYTNYARFSTFTGRQTIIGWAVHEWLWRGSYDVVSPRREEVRQIYESTDDKITREILKKYDISLIVVGKLEREKFTQLNEHKIGRIAKEVFRSGQTVLYLLTN